MEEGREKQTGETKMAVAASATTAVHRRATERERVRARACNIHRLKIHHWRASADTICETIWSFGRWFWTTVVLKPSPSPSLKTDRHLTFSGISMPAYRASSIDHVTADRFLYADIMEIVRSSSPFYHSRKSLNNEKVTSLIVKRAGEENRLRFRQPVICRKIVAEPSRDQ